MSFEFRLETVLKVREHERNLRRQSVAIARIEHSRQIANRDRIAAERTAVIDELRDLKAVEAIPIEKVTTRQRHVEQLGCELELAESSIDRASRFLQSCLQSLILSNQSVQVLERLAQRQQSEFAKTQSDQEAREFDDQMNGLRRAA